MKNPYNSIPSNKVTDIDSSEYRNKNGNNELKVSPLELFGDLIMVVVIYVVSDSFTWKVLERENVMKKIYCMYEHCAKYCMYIVCMFLLWYFWHNSIVITNLGNIMSLNDMGPFLHEAFLRACSSFWTLQSLAKKQ